MKIDVRFAHTFFREGFYAKRKKSELVDTAFKDSVDILVATLVASNGRFSSLPNSWQLKPIQALSKYGAHFEYRVMNEYRAIFKQEKGITKGVINIIFLVFCFRRDLKDSVKREVTRAKTARKNK